METFYRWMRTRSNVLMREGTPEGGKWNYDSENRASFGKGGPGALKPRKRFAPDAITREAIADVARFAAEQRRCTSVAAQRSSRATRSGRACASATLRLRRGPD
jgi:deoxyribodipyrimidine photolyase-like uncharacterized protein